MVAAEDRHAHRAGDERRGGARRSRRAEVDEVVAPVGERLDDRRQARDADLQARVERDVDLGHRAEAAVDVVVGADDLDLEAGHAALAQLVERVRDAVHAADGVGDERDAQRLALAAGELGLLAAEEGRRRGVGDRRQAGVEERGRGGRRGRRSSGVGRRRSRPRPCGRACARARAWRGGTGRRGRSPRAAGSAISSLSSRSSSTAASQARSSARASSGHRPVSVSLERASPSRMRRWTIVKIAAGSGAAPSLAPRPSARVASAIAACVHFAALPCSPSGVASPAATWSRNSRHVAHAGVWVKVRPMSTPAWSSEPPTPVPPWVSM